MHVSTRWIRRPAAAATFAAVILGVAAVALGFSSSAKADSASSLKIWRAGPACKLA